MPSERLFFDVFLRIESDEGVREWLRREKRIKEKIPSYNLIQNQMKIFSILLDIHHGDFHMVQAGKKQKSKEF